MEIRCRMCEKLIYDSPFMHQSPEFAADSRCDDCAIPVTDEMIAVGEDFAVPPSKRISIYRAMAAKAPNEIADRRHQIIEALNTVRDERDAALARAEAAESSLATLLGINNALTDENVAFRDRLAKFTTDEPKPDPDLAHNPFREFSGDRRRVGG